MTEKAICWDMDCTLGDFDEVHDELAGNKHSLFPLSLRAKLKPVLEELSQEEFFHFVTSRSISLNARTCIERADLTKYFRDVLGRETVCMQDEYYIGDGKCYAEVARQMGFSPKEASANMVVVGDGIIDKPLDLEGLVFILQERAFSYSAEVPKKIIKKLLEKGNGNFFEGFKSIYKEAKLVLFSSGKEMFREYYFDEEIKVHLSYESKSASKSGEKSIPIVDVIDAKEYYSKLDLVKK